MAFLSLPPEILPTIFGFLPVSDRKSVRLTCQSFRSACDRADILNREKFVFHFGHFEDRSDVSSFADYIGDCRRLRPEVEFRGVELEQFSSRVWEKFGDRITSILIENCGLSDNVLVHILLKCSKLVDLRIHVPTGYKLFVTGSNVINRMISLGVRRPQLNTFKLSAHQSPGDDTFRKMLTIFPNIQTFGLDQFHESNQEGLPFRCTCAVSSSLGEFQLPPPWFVNSTCRRNANKAWMVPYIEYPTLQFKELDFTVQMLDHRKMEEINNFFLSQIELQKISLKILIESQPSDSAKNILLQILRKLPKLKALKFHSNCELDLSVSEFKELLLAINKLESLDLCFCPINRAPLDFSVGVLPFDLPPTLQLPQIEYRELTHLRLNFGHARVTRLQSEIVSRCRSLQCLHLENVDNETLRSIFRDHMKLRKLYLNFENCHDYPTEGDHFSHRHQGLEQLDVRNVFYVRENVVPTSERSLFGLVHELDCPNLKVFRFDGRNPYLSEKGTFRFLEMLEEKTPLLETLIMSSALPFDKYCAPLKNFKKLRYVVRTTPHCYSNQLEDPQTDGVKHLFDACPSLTYVVNSVEGDLSVAFFYRRMTGSLVLKYNKSCQCLCETLNIPSYGQ